MNFKARFPEDGDIEGIMIYLRELRGELSGIDKEILKIAKEAANDAVSTHVASFHNA